ncbi:hypothetical protein ABW19_dt0203381 [Dactylella cylindrospora]|nr:hypothetical protein ABW19_dt0203381 [Dactylella cylindrospora]
MSSQSPPKQNYIHGHHPSVLTSHSWRTLQNSAAYLIPHLDAFKLSPSYITPTAPTNLLDAGCGPGTITCDLASHLPNTQITGIDAVLLDSCLTLASTRGLKNLTFQQADIYNLPFPDDYFDIIHLHQVLQHLPTPPIAAIKELIRVCKPGGIIASRDCDIEAFTLFPDSDFFKAWKRVYISTAVATGGDPLAGRKEQKWFMEAGVERGDIVCSSSNWTFSTEEERRWWAEMWAERYEKSELREKAVGFGVVDGEGMDGIAKGWREWVGVEEGWMMAPSGEVVVRVWKGKR